MPNSMIGVTQDIDNVSVYWHDDFPVVLCNPHTGGDLDENGVVDFADFLIISVNFGQAVDSHFDGDVNCDGIVDFGDFLTLSSNFGQPAGDTAAAHVPESTGMAALMPWIAFGILRRKSPRRGDGKH